MNMSWNKEDNIDKEILIEIMDVYNLKQHVLIQTHKQGNRLDWIIPKENSSQYQEYKKEITHQIIVL